MDSVTVCTPLSFKASATAFAEKSRRINTPEAEVEVFKLTLVWAWSPVTGLRSASVRKEGLLFKMQLLPRATEHETAVASGAKADTDARPAVDLDVVQDLHVVSLNITALDTFDLDSVGPNWEELRCSEKPFQLASSKLAVRER